MDFDEAAYLAYQKTRRQLPEGFPYCAICLKEVDGITLSSNAYDRTLEITIRCHGAEEKHKIMEKDVTLYEGKFEWDLAFKLQEITDATCGRNPRIVASPP